MLHATNRTKSSGNVDIKTKRFSAKALYNKIQTSNGIAKRVQELERTETGFK